MIEHHDNFFKHHDGFCKFLLFFHTEMSKISTTESQTLKSVPEMSKISTTESQTLKTQTEMHIKDQFPTISTPISVHFCIEIDAKNAKKVPNRSEATQETERSDSTRVLGTSGPIGP